MTQHLDQLEHMQEINRSLNDLRVDIATIKARLFNDIMETLRETYAQVIVLDNKQKEMDVRLTDFQTGWIADFTKHDAKERIYHVAVTGVMVATLIGLGAIFALEFHKLGSTKEVAAVFGKYEATSPKGHDSSINIGP